MPQYDNLSVDELINQATPETPDLTIDPAQALFNANPPVEKTVDELIAEAAQTAKDVTGLTPEEADAKVVADEVAAKAELEKPAKEKQKVAKIEESTKSVINTLITDGVLKGFDDGKYETVNDLKELINLNIEDKVTSWQEEYAKSFYEQGGPIWGTILEAAKTARTPQELIPLLEAADDYDYSLSLNTDTDESCEEIIRATLTIKGLDNDVIESDIEDFKTRGILKDRAEKFKPTLDKFNEQRLTQLRQERFIQEQNKNQFYQNHINTVVKNVIDNDAPGGFKLKNEQKHQIASMFVPDKEIGGLPIYTAIDNLLASGDYNRLSQIAMLILDNNLFDKLYSSKVANNVADGLQRKLRDSRTSGQNETVIEQNSDNQTLSRPRLVFKM